MRCREKERQTGRGMENEREVDMERDGGTGVEKCRDKWKEGRRHDKTRWRGKGSLLLRKLTSILNFCIFRFVMQGFHLFMCSCVSIC